MPLLPKPIAPIVMSFFLALSSSGCGPLDGLFDPAAQSAKDSIRTLESDLATAVSELDAISFDEAARRATPVPTLDLKTLSAQDLLDGVSQFAKVDGPALLLKGSKASFPDLNSTAQAQASLMLAAELSEPLVKLEFSLLGHDLGELVCLTSSDEAQRDRLKSRCGLLRAASQLHDSLNAFALLTSRITTLGAAQAKGFDVLDEKIVAVIQTAAFSQDQSEALKAALKDLEVRVRVIREANSKLKIGMDALGGLGKAAFKNSSDQLEAAFGAIDGLDLSSIDTQLGRLNSVGSAFLPPGPCTILSTGLVAFDGDLSCFSEAVMTTPSYPAEDFATLNASMELVASLASELDAKSPLLAATQSMEETRMSFNLQYLQLQSQMQHENRSYTAISNIMKTKHDTVKNSISNVR